MVMKNKALISAFNASATNMHANKPMVNMHTLTESVTKTCLVHFCPYMKKGLGLVCIN